MGYFKRRIKDSWQITKEIFSCVTWKNAIITIPWLLFLIFFSDEADYQVRKNKYPY
jgi:hypothetical protein